MSTKLKSMNKIHIVATILFFLFPLAVAFSAKLYEIRGPKTVVLEITSMEFTAGTLVVTVDTIFTGNFE